MTEDEAGAEEVHGRRSYLCVHEKGGKHRPLVSKAAWLRADECFE